MTGVQTCALPIWKRPGALRPSWSNQGVSEGMSPSVFLGGVHWKAWDGRLAVGFLRGERIVILQLDSAGKTVGTTTVPGLPGERIRSLVQGPDGALYVATDGGEIWRVAPRTR